MTCIGAADSSSKWNTETVAYVAQLMKDDAVTNPRLSHSFWFDVLDHTSKDDTDKLIDVMNIHYRDATCYAGLISRKKEIIPSLYENIMKPPLAADIKKGEISYYRRSKLSDIGYFNAKKDLLWHIDKVTKGNTDEETRKLKFAIFEKIANDIIECKYDPDKAKNPLACILLSARSITSVNRSSSSIKLLNMLLRNNAPNPLHYVSPLGEEPESYFACFYRFFVTVRPITSF